MRILKAVALLLVIVGAINWLLVGVAQFDLVAAITGDTFGETNALSSVVYILVGLSGVALLPTLATWLTKRLRGRHRLSDRRCHSGAVQVKKPLVASTGGFSCVRGGRHCSADHTLEHDHEWAADQAGRRSGRGVLARLPFAPGLDAGHRSPVLQPDPGQPSLSALRLTVRGGRWAADAAHRQAAVGRQSERLQLVSEGAPQAPWRRRGRRLDAVRRHPRLDCHGRADVPRRISRVAQPLLHRCLRGRLLRQRRGRQVRR